MARSIAATPTLKGEDAERLLRDLEQTCSADERSRRIREARAFRAELMRPKLYTTEADMTATLLSLSNHKF